MTLQGEFSHKGICWNWFWAVLWNWSSTTV